MLSIILQRMYSRKKRTYYILAAGIFIIIISFFLLKNRNDEPINKAALEKQNARSANPFNKASVNLGLKMLHTGDLVVRTGADVTSYMFSQMNQTEKTYSHCGIVIIENGYPFVYHSIGGEDNPDQELRRDSAKFWVSPANNLGYGIARFSFFDGQIKALTQVVQRLYREKRKFDMNFDLKTDDRLYCAEFVYKAVNEAMKDSQYLRPITVLGYRFIGVDNLFLNQHAKLIWQVRYK